MNGAGAMGILTMFSTYLDSARNGRRGEGKAAATSAAETQTIRIRIGGMGLAVVVQLPRTEPARNEFDLLAKGHLEAAHQPLSELTWDQRDALEDLARITEQQAQ